MYGDDPHAPLPDQDDEAGGVEVPVISLELSDDAQQALNSNFNPLVEDNNYGIEVNLQVSSIEDGGTRAFLPEGCLDTFKMSSFVSNRNLQGY